MTSYNSNSQQPPRYIAYERIRRVLFPETTAPVEVTQSQGTQKNKKDSSTSDN